VTDLLIVDDEPQIVRALKIALDARGYKIRSAGNGETALEMIAARAPDVVVLDLGLPGIDGVEVARRLRSFSAVPIIVLSARDAQQEKVAALDAGADDYLTKPFGMDELLARIRAVLRRAPAGAQAPSVARFGDIEIDLGKRMIKKAGAQVHLTPTEYELLSALAAHPGKLLTQRWLLERVWGVADESSAPNLRVYIGQLRRKLEDDHARPRWILTEPGLGYRWAET
jgi:two-component system KDP operon response regulator KdpE